MFFDIQSGSLLTERVVLSCIVCLMTRVKMAIVQTMGWNISSQCSLFLVVKSFQKEVVKTKIQQYVHNESLIDSNTQLTTQYDMCRPNLLRKKKPAESSRNYYKMNSNFKLIIHTQKIKDTLYLKLRLRNVRFWPSNRNKNSPNLPCTGTRHHSLIKGK